MAKESAKVKAREFEDYQTVDDLEIQGMQGELEELEEEVQDHGVVLMNRDNLINNLQAKILLIPRSEKEGTKPPYMCPGCSNHTHGNNMINRCNVINKRVIFLT
jgi:hypothetical protein